MTTESNICVAVCRRVSRAAFAVVGHDGVYELCCCAAPAHNGHQLLRKAQVLADAYGAQTIVAEPGIFADATSDTTVVTTTLSDVKERLCGSDDCGHRDLIEVVIRDHPEVKRVVAGAVLSGPCANRDRWRTLPVLAIALGLSFLQP